MANQVLLIHTETALRAATRRALDDTGLALTEADDLPGALRISAALRPDLILLPWTARDLTRGAIARLREHEHTRQSRLIVLAERDSRRDAITALEFGADDCIGLPLDHVELIVRLQACLRRPPASLRPDRLTAGPLLLDKVSHRLSISGTQVELAPAEFRLMAFLLENQGRVFSRAELLRRAWSKNIKAGHRTVDVHVRRLRQTLERFDCDRMIQTVRGFGYRFSIAQAPGPSIEPDPLSGEPRNSGGTRT